MTSRSDEPRNPRPGLPLNGSAGTWLGRDAEGRPWLLVWHERGEWNALGFERPEWPVLKRGAEVAALIETHEPADGLAAAWDWVMS